MLNKLIFSDLDGTLLNHDDYSFEAALPALERIKEQNIPLILVTSKTFSEVVPLQQKLGITRPFIVENGAGIFIPSSSPLACGIASQDEYIKISQAKSYLELRLFFKKLKHHHAIRGFGDMSTQEVMELTGLDEKSAQNAMKRDFSEPFIADEDVYINDLAFEAQKEGLDIVQGGRFYHLISQGQDKAKAMLHLAHLYEACHSKKYKIIALGDSYNDAGMLQSADVGVLIQNAKGGYAKIEGEKIIRSSHAGAQGWSESLLELL